MLVAGLMVAWSVPRGHERVVALGHNDAVANALLAHSTDNHRVLTQYGDGLQAHLFLDDLAGSHAEGTHEVQAAAVRPDQQHEAMKEYIAANPDSMAAAHMAKYV